MNGAPLNVGIVGCGLIGHKRAASLRREDEVIGATDVDVDAADVLALHDERRGGPYLWRERHLAMQPQGPTARSLPHRRQSADGKHGAPSEFASNCEVG